MDDPFAVLGLDPGAGRDEIKSAYRALAKVWHPDRHRGDGAARERFVEINEAYRALTNRTTAPSPRSSGFGRRRPQADATVHAKPVVRPKTHEKPEPSDDEMMERIFGVSPARRRIDDAPSLDGMAEAAAEPAPEPAADAAAPSTAVRSVRAALNALFGRRGRKERTDSAAGGERPTDVETATIDVPLSTIVAGGMAEAALSDGSVVVADIARGTAEGTVVVLPPDSTGRSRPVELTVAYVQTETFSSLGADLHTSLVIGLETAVLGGQKTLDTLDGSIRLTVPAWSGSDRTLRVTARGLPRADGSRGDLHVHLRVLLPETPDPRLIELMQKRKDGFYV